MGGKHYIAVFWQEICVWRAREGLAGMQITL